jgi:hypothetical protein
MLKYSELFKQVQNFPLWFTHVCGPCDINIKRCSKSYIHNFMSLHQHRFYCVKAERICLAFLY